MCATTESCWDWLPDVLAWSITDVLNLTALRQLSLCSKGLKGQCWTRMKDVRAAYQRVVDSCPHLLDIRSESARRLIASGPHCNDELCHAYSLVHRLFPPIDIELHRGYITDCGAAALLSAFKLNGEFSLASIRPCLTVIITNNNITNVVPFIELLSVCKRRPGQTRLEINLRDNNLCASKANLDAVFDYEIAKLATRHHVLISARTSLRIDGSPLAPVLRARLQAARARLQAAAEDVGLPN